MNKQSVKELLQKIAAEAEDTSARKSAENLLKELETTTDKVNKSENIPKSLLKKILDFIAKFFLRMVQHEAVHRVMEMFDDLSP